MIRPVTGTLPIYADKLCSRIETILYGPVRIPVTVTVLTVFLPVTSRLEDIRAPITVPGGKRYL
jgi:hypothetical protein